MTDAPKAEDKNVKILNWMDNDYAMEVTEGIKFDPEKLYTLELTEIRREQKHNEDKEVNSLILMWTEMESNVVIRQTHEPKDHPEQGCSGEVRFACQTGRASWLHCQDR